VLRRQPMRPPVGSPNDYAATGSRRACTTTTDPPAQRRQTPGRHRQPPPATQPAIVLPLRARKASDSTVLLGASEPAAWQRLAGALAAGGAFARPHAWRCAATGAPTGMSSC